MLTSEEYSEDNHSQNQPMYNILGLRVGKDYRGMVIQGGEKINRTH